MGESIVQICKLHFAQGARRIFNGANFDARTREITAFMRPGGAGKTTLFKIISAQLRPESGNVKVLGEDIHRIDPVGAGSGGDYRQNRC